MTNLLKLIRCTILHLWKVAADTTNWLLTKWIRPLLGRANLQMRLDQLRVQLVHKTIAEVAHLGPIAYDGRVLVSGNDLVLGRVLKVRVVSCLIGAKP
jgi:hypothetical protein